MGFSSPVRWANCRRSILPSRAPGVGQMVALSHSRSAQPWCLSKRSASFVCPLLGAYTIEGDGAATSALRCHAPTKRAEIIDLKSGAGGAPPRLQRHPKCPSKPHIVQHVPTNTTMKGAEETNAKHTSQTIPRAGKIAPRAGSERGVRALRTGSVEAEFGGRRRPSTPWPSKLLGESWLYPRSLGKQSGVGGIRFAGAGLGRSVILTNQALPCRWVYFGFGNLRVFGPTARFCVQVLPPTGQNHH